MILSLIIDLVEAMHGFQFWGDHGAAYSKGKYDNCIFSS